MLPSIAGFLLPNEVQQGALTSKIMGGINRVAFIFFKKKHLQILTDTACKNAHRSDKTATDKAFTLAGDKGL
ncbi:hypothetical protein [Methyloglobulus morosus]|uniref:hypothetical protein n=1 Tax=Methyloglobulus morosus TaxID=1410681 RepID=UPI0004238931|nr:hypothetical protein [Methyloglobulus morosus]